MPNAELKKSQFGLFCIRHLALGIDIMKFGNIKRQHGRVGGLDPLLDRIVEECPHVTRIIPGRIKVRRGKTQTGLFKVQYPTPAGLKCLYSGTGTVQEVFLICRDEAKARQWLLDAGIAAREASSDEQ